MPIGILLFRDVAVFGPGGEVNGMELFVARKRSFVINGEYVVQQIAPHEDKRPLKNGAEETDFDTAIRCLIRRTGFNVFEVAWRMDPRHPEQPMKIQFTEGDLNITFFVAKLTTTNKTTERMEWSLVSLNLPGDLGYGQFHRYTDLALRIDRVAGHDYYNGTRIFRLLADIHFVYHHYNEKRIDIQGFYRNMNKVYKRLVYCTSIQNQNMFALYPNRIYENDPSIWYRIADIVQLSFMKFSRSGAPMTCADILRAVYMAESCQFTVDVTLTFIRRNF